MTHAVSLRRPPTITHPSPGPRGLIRPPVITPADDAPPVVLAPSTPVLRGVLGGIGALVMAHELVRASTYEAHPVDPATDAPAPGAAVLVVPGTLGECDPGDWIAHELVPGGRWRVGRVVATPAGIALGGGRWHPWPVRRASALDALGSAALAALGARAGGHVDTVPREGAGPRALALRGLTPRALDAVRVAVGGVLGAVVTAADAPRVACRVVVGAEVLDAAHAVDALGAPTAAGCGWWVLGDSLRQWGRVGAGGV